MAKKTTTSKAAEKSTTAPKTAKASSEPKKVEKSASVKAKTAEKATTAKPVEKKKAAETKIPSWLKPSPTDYAAGTEDYRRLVEEHNKLFNTHWNPWRCRPQVFWGIHETVSKHYAKK